MMDLQKWEEGLKAWTLERDEALVRVEQAEFLISAFSKKIEELKGVDKNGE